MDKSEKLEKLLEKASAELNEELQERVEIYYESLDEDEKTTLEPFKKGDALFELMDVMEANEETRNRMYKECRRLLIGAGYYRLIDEAELARTITNGGKKYDFTESGQKYVWAGW